MRQVLSDVNPTIGNAQTFSSHAAALDSHVCVVLSATECNTGDCVQTYHSQREHQILQQTAYYGSDCQEVRIMHTCSLLRIGQQSGI